MEEIIRVEKLRKVYRTGFFLKPIEVLKGLSFAVRKNEIYGFLGPNGAGKTTTIKILNSIVHPTGGEVAIFREPITGVKNKGRIGYMPEQPYFYEYLTAREFLLFCGNLFGFKKSDLSGKISSLLSLVGLSGAAGTQLRKFSKGMLQRIGIAQSLINDPELVLLDEPMSGLDPIGRLEIRELIRNLKRQGKTVFFSSHIISDVELLSDRVCILNRGVKMAEGRIEELIGTRAIKYFEFDVKNIDDGPKLLEELGTTCVGHFTRGNVQVLRIASEEFIDGAVDSIKAHGGKITGIIPARVNLEELFMEKISEPESDR